MTPKKIFTLYSTVGPQGVVRAGSSRGPEHAATFERGSIRFSTLEPDVIRTGTDSGPADVETGGDGYVRELEYFAGCIGQRIPPEKCLAEESLAAVELCGELKRLAEPGCGALTRLQASSSNLL